MNLKLLTISAAAILTLALFISGCGAKPHETPKQAAALTDASVGDIVVFGDIRWYVIAKTADGCTLLSEKPVIKKAFRDAEYQAFDGTWEKSTLRAWLNGQFYDTFTEAEKALIARTHNVNADNSEHGTSGGNDTDDYIYLLSVDEAKALDSKILKCGYWYGQENQWWWLRSPGVNESYIAYVGNNSNGKNTIDPTGDIAGNAYGAVRPALTLRFTDQAALAALNQNQSKDASATPGTGSATTPAATNAFTRTPAEEQAELAAMAAAEKGDVVTFGRYTWIVAEKSDGTCTLLCQGPVANMPYNDTKEDTTWETCSLRKWLNEDFYNTKFTAGEQAAIITSHNTFTEEDSPYDMDCGNATDDKVYLFTYTESKIVSDAERGMGIEWWLRSPGKRQEDAVYILGHSANLMGNTVSYSMGVRPTIKVKYSD